MSTWIFKACGHKGHRKGCAECRYHAEVRKAARSQKKWLAWTRKQKRRKV